MGDSPLISAAEFAEKKYDLPEGGRWTELVAGEVVQYQPPDEKHGTVVLNLSKSLARYFQGAEAENAGEAAFELGLHVARDPDTVRTPPVCCFRGESRFAVLDEVVTDRPPAVVAEIASTNDRRRNMAQRVEEYLRWGVPLVWVIDPHQEQVHVLQQGQPQKQLGARDSLIGFPVLPGFSIRVTDLFAEPKWWREHK